MKINIFSPITASPTRITTSPTRITTSPTRITASPITTSYWCYSPITYDVLVIEPNNTYAVLAGGAVILLLIISIVTITIVILKMSSRRIARAPAPVPQQITVIVSAAPAPGGPSVGYIPFSETKSPVTSTLPPPSYTSIAHSSLPAVQPPSYREVINTGRSGGFQ